MPRKDGKPTKAELEQARALRQLYAWAYGTGLGMPRKQLIRNINYLVAYLKKAEKEPEEDELVTRQREALCDGYCDAAYARGILDAQ